LHVVAAIAAGLEGVDAHDLRLSEPGRQGGLCIGALVFHLGLRALRREIEMLRRQSQEIGDHRHVFARRPRRRTRRRRIDRLRRARIDRRLGQHIVFEHDGLVGAALGVALAPLVGDRLPIGARLVVELLACLGVFLELAAVFDHRRRSGRRSRRRDAGTARTGGAAGRWRQHREETEDREAAQTADATNGHGERLRLHLYDPDLAETMGLAPTARHPRTRSDIGAA
jgi:hypothetical protein